MFSPLINPGSREPRLNRRIAFKSPNLLKASLVENGKLSRPRWPRAEVGSQGRMGRRPSSEFRHPRLNTKSRHSKFTKANSNSAEGLFEKSQLSQESQHSQFTSDVASLVSPFFSCHYEWLVVCCSRVGSRTTRVAASSAKTREKWLLI